MIGIICWIIFDKLRFFFWFVFILENICLKFFVFICWVSWLIVFFIVGFCVNCCNIFFIILGEFIFVCWVISDKSLFKVGLLRSCDIMFVIFICLFDLCGFICVVVKVCLNFWSICLGVVLFELVLLVTFRDVRDCRICWLLVLVCWFWLELIEVLFFLFLSCILDCRFCFWL